MKRLVLGLLVGLISLGVRIPSAGAVIVDDAGISLISTSDVVQFPDPEPTGSGLGTLDLILFSFSNGGAGNDPSGSLNFDNANTDMPGGSTTSGTTTSGTTTGGDTTSGTTTSGTTTSCSANRLHAHGSDSSTEVSST